MHLDTLADRDEVYLSCIRQKAAESKSLSPNSSDCVWKDYKIYDPISARKAKIMPAHCAPTGKKQFPDLYYITDVCMCEYTSHGHCGVLCGHEVENDATLELLAKTALSHVEAGADMVAPSDMMDGRVRAIRECLDKAGHKEAPIMSYAVKYASAFYGPFRDAAGSAPAFGDRKSYQMDYHNRREGMKEALTDIEEGADIIMIKPAMSYLDMVSEVYKATNVPIAAYSVSVNMQWSKQQPRWAGSMRTRLCARWQQVLTVQVFLFI